MIQAKISDVGFSHITFQDTSDITEVPDKEGIIQPHFLPQRILLFKGGVLRKDLVDRISPGQVHRPENEQGRCQKRRDQDDDPFENVSEHI